MSMAKASEWYCSNPGKEWGQRVTCTLNFVLTSISWSTHNDTKDICVEGLVMDKEISILSTYFSVSVRYEKMMVVLTSGDNILRFKGKK